MDTTTGGTERHHTETAGAGSAVPPGAGPLPGAINQAAATTAGTTPADPAAATATGTTPADPAAPPGDKAPPRPGHGPGQTAQPAHQTPPPGDRAHPGEKTPPGSGHTTPAAADRPVTRPRDAVARRRVLRAGAAATLGGTLGACDTGPGPGPAGRKGAVTPPPGRTDPAAGDGDWRLTHRGPDHAIEGYTDQCSIRPGDPLTLRVSTTSAAFRVSVLRVGWYGGAQARLIWRSGRVAGGPQRRPRFTVATRTVHADWKPSLRLDGRRTADWPEGAYLLRLEAGSGHQRYVPLVVRSASAAGRTLLMHAPATWQAYNAWGGYSLYQGRDGSYAHRSLKVAFDRPYEGSGAEKFLVYERALVVLAERLGIPLAYTTGIDVHRDPSVLRGARAAVVLGHDEYWTPERRRHVAAARDAGTNLAFLGANTCYRRIRLEPGPGGGRDRTVVCYKTAWAADPYLARHPGMATTDFRSHPAPDPESRLTGVIYDGYPVDAPYVVLRPDHWLFAGTGVRAGESFAHLVGVEYDRVNPSYPPPGPTEVLAHSPVVCEGRRSHSDSAYCTVAGGAGVFASGTMRWVEGLMAGTGADGRDHGMDARTRRFVTRVTENLLHAFAAGPAGRTHPAPRDNVRALYGR